jgi:hypothetical protein
MMNLRRGTRPRHCRQFSFYSYRLRPLSPPFRNVTTLRPLPLTSHAVSTPTYLHLYSLIFPALSNSHFRLLILPSFSDSHLRLFILFSLSYSHLRPFVPPLPCYHSNYYAVQARNCVANCYLALSRTLILDKFHVSLISTHFDGP